MYQEAKLIVSDSVEMSHSMDAKELQQLANEQSEMYPLGPTISLAYLSVLKDCEVHCFNEGSEVKRLGGLHVIGTSLHESRRIDNQVSYLQLQFHRSKDSKFIQFFWPDRSFSRVTKVSPTYNALC